MGLEGAARLAEMARAYSGCEVLQQNFLELNLPPGHFDGVFANAVLFHVPSLALPLSTYNTFGEVGYVPAVSVAPGETGLGHLLMGQYLLPFEVVSVLLLAALVGAVVIVRKELS